MPTKEEIDKWRDNWLDIKVTIPEKCIICNKWEYWDIHLIKIPEIVEMCLVCSELYEDNNTYKWKDWWRAIYKIWEWFIDNTDK